MTLGKLLIYCSRCRSVTRHRYLNTVIEFDKEIDLYICENCGEIVKVCTNIKRTRKSHKRQINVSIDEELLKKIDDLVGQGYFKSRAHLIRVALNNFLEDFEKRLEYFERTLIKKHEMKVIA